MDGDGAAAAARPVEVTRTRRVSIGKAEKKTRSGSQIPRAADQKGGEDQDQGTG